MDILKEAFFTIAVSTKLNKQR